MFVVSDESSSSRRDTEAVVVEVSSGHRQTQWQNWEAKAKVTDPTHQEKAMEGGRTPETDKEM